jgi:hypothetical protein
VYSTHIFLGCTASGFWPSGCRRDSSGSGAEFPAASCAGMGGGIQALTSL